MAAYMKMTGLDGESTDEGHKNWILIESMSSGISRSINSGAKDNERRGATHVSDVTISRQIDKSSVPLQVKAASGDLIDEVEIHFCQESSGKREPFLKYKLAKVIVSSYSVGIASGESKPHESISLNFSKVDWTYIPFKDNKPDGNVPGSYDLATGKAT
jgi:type VI secretion system secreted protein Hcp